MSESDVKSPRRCPSCAAPIGATARSCWTCGDELPSSQPEAHAEIANDATEQLPLVEWKEQDATAPAVTPIVGVSSPLKSRSLALVGGAGVLACVTAIVVLQSLQPAASPQPAEAIRSEVPAVAAAPAVESAPAPVWVGDRQASWANDGSKTVSFELKATSDVNVWMARVRPLLVVRCLYRTTEVFVAIRSAASIEGEAGNHTVRLQIDNDSELIQEWTDSVSGQELFAPDSVALARRLASAQRMRFSFTPYNAKPATAEFSVVGFEKLASLVGNTCGWKLETPPIRTARSN
jgi:hypothetical protein